MAKMRAPPKFAALASAEREPYSAILEAVLVVAILAVLIVQLGAIEALDHSGLLR